MELSENYRARLKKIAGILIESMHPQFMDCGFYDMCNGDCDTLLELLEKNQIIHTYDSYRNYIIIETDSPRDIIPYMEEARIYKAESDYMKELMGDPNDCVLLRLPTPNVPSGAMM